MKLWTLPPPGEPEEPEEAPEEEQKMVGTPFFRSVYDGYQLKETICEDGISRNEFVYTGVLHVLETTRRERILRKVYHTLLLCGTVLCIALGGMQRSAVTMSVFTAIPVMALILMTTLRFFAVLIYWISPVEMESWDFKYSVRHLRTYSLLSAIFSALALLSSVGVMLAAGDRSTAALLGALIHIPELFFALASYWIEKKTDYGKKDPSAS
jgi:hypothetical protein